MKIEVSKKEFVKALSLGGAFAGISKVLPILECVKIKVGLNNLTIVSTDNENAVSKRLEGIMSDEECTFCINLKDLLSYVKLIPTDTVYINKDVNTLTISHQRGKMDLPCVSADDFPVIKADANSIDTEMRADLLMKWIADGKTFVSNDEFRPIMAGLYVYSQNGEIGCCATDGHILYTDRIGTGDMPEFNFILNRNAFRPLSDILNGLESIKVRVGGNHVMFIGNDVSIIARKKEGKYPNFMSVIPQTNNIHAVLNRKEMLDAISRCSVGVNRESMLVRVNVCTDKIELSCEDLDLSKKTKENIDATSDGSLTIGFKLSCLTQVLSSMQSEEITISMKNPATAAIIKDNQENRNALYLIMPMLLS